MSENISALKLTNPPNWITEGTIVNYVLPHGRNAGESRPAIVVRVWRGVEQKLIDQGYCNLVVFIDGSNDYPDQTQHTLWATSILYSDDNRLGTWHWPEIPQGVLNLAENLKVGVPETDSDWPVIGKFPNYTPAVPFPPCEFDQ